MPALTDWLTRLNASNGRLQVGNGRLEVLHWAREEDFQDNLPHRHTYFEACLVGDVGSGSFLVRGANHPLRPGTLFLARPGVVHQILNDSGPHMDMRWLCFGWAVEEGAPKNDAERLMRAFAASTSLVAHDAYKVETLWRALEVLASGPGCTGMREQLEDLTRVLVVAIAQALADYDPSASMDEAIMSHTLARLAVRYIEDNLNRPLNLEEIASHIGVSARHLSRLFGDFTGTSPAQYTLRARLDRASSLLVRTNAPIKEIAQETGFSDVQYLTRRFTMHFGCPPAEYRRRGGGSPIVQSRGVLV